MIAGETEYVLDDQLHDDFFGNKEKRRKRRAARKARRLRRRSDPKRLARKKRRRSFFSKLGEAYRDIGGGQAIGGAVDTILSKPIATDTGTQEETSEDFSIGLGTDTKNRNQKEKKTNYTPYIIGGVVLLGLGGVMIYKSNQNKYVHITKQ